MLLQLIQESSLEGESLQLIQGLGCSLDLTGATPVTRVQQFLQAVTRPIRFTIPRGCPNEFVVLQRLLDLDTGADEALLQHYAGKDMFKRVAELSIAYSHDRDNAERLKAIEQIINRYRKVPHERNPIQQTS